MCFTGGKKCLFYHFFMENHSIQFTTIAINVERGIVKILFKYRYFQDLLIDIDISFNTSYRYRYWYRYFPKSPFRYRYRYRYFWIVLIDIVYRYRIFFKLCTHIDIDIDIDIFQKCRYIDNRYVISIYRTGLHLQPP